MVNRGMNMQLLESILSGQENINMKQKRRHIITMALQIAGEKQQPIPT